MAYRVKKNYILLPLVFVLSTYVADLIAGRNYMDECPELSCRPNGPGVRFPFRIIGKHARNCGYEGFEIYCSSINDSILHLPDGSANLYVTRIDYRLQQLYVRDEPASSCLPKKNNSYNLSSSPFQFNPDNAYNTTLFNCSIISMAKYSMNDCLSSTVCDYPRLCYPWTVECSDDVDQHYQVIALRNDLSPCFMARVTSCPKLYEAAVTFKGDAQPDVILSWSTPDCTSCEEKVGGTCIPNKYNSSEPQVDCLIQTYNEGSLFSTEYLLFTCCYNISPSSIL
ncbi:hypothetical protein ACFE04_009325 [Oxalis oulophora]